MDTIIKAIVFLPLTGFLIAGIGGNTIGAIVLTLRHRQNIKRQSIPQQVARTPETAVEVVTVKPGQGI